MSFTAIGRGLARPELSTAGILSGRSMDVIRNRDPAADAHCILRHGKAPVTGLRVIGNLSGPASSPRGASMRTSTVFILSICCALAHAGEATLFDEQFTGSGPALGAAWAASGWHLDGSGRAVETEGGYATALVGSFAGSS